MDKAKKNSRILEGVILLMKHNYIKGIFAISCLFMIEVTIIDYTMKVLAHDHFSTLHRSLKSDGYNSSQMSSEATSAFTKFMGMFGFATNGLSFLLSFFGTSKIIQTLGLRLTL